MFVAIREFPFRFTTKLSGKKFSCKVSFENGLLEADFRKNFHLAGVTGGDIMWILSRGNGCERATKAGIGKRGVFGRFDGGKRGIKQSLLAKSRRSVRGKALFRAFGHVLRQDVLPCPIGANRPCCYRCTKVYGCTICTRQCREKKKYSFFSFFYGQYGCGGLVQRGGVVTNTTDVTPATDAPKRRRGSSFTENHKGTLLGAGCTKCYKYSGVIRLILISSLPVRL